MFGYVIPDKPNMLMKDFTEFRAYYCGLCKALGRDNPALLRLLTNYDCTFLTVLFHNLEGVAPEIKMQGCVLNPVKKKAVVAKSDVMKKAAALTVLLAYYKAGDDVSDGGGLKAARVRSSLAFYAKKAARLIPEADAVIANRYKELESSRTVWGSGFIWQTPWTTSIRTLKPKITTPLSPLTPT